MSQTQINAAILDHVIADGTLPADRIFTNREFKDALDKTDPFIAVDILPASNTDLDINSANRRESGIVQFSVYVREAVGEFPALRIAEEIQLLFPRFLRLGTTVEFNSSPSIGVGFHVGNGWFQVPVTIDYVQLVQ